MADSEFEIKPQPGPQTMFMQTPADIAIYGGAAGGGKSFGLLLDPLRHYNNWEVGVVIFRKTSVQVRNTGGLWDESLKIYKKVKGHPQNAYLKWTFPSGFNIRFSHLEHDNDVYNFQGAQIAVIGFDELTHFTSRQFWYMLSRNRSTSGVKPYVRATTNPDADSWVRELIDWWIDKETGLAIPERSGVLRWFVRINDTIIWGDTKEELIAKYGEKEKPKSLTFIAAKLEDNKKMTDADPNYEANLRALSYVDRARLQDGNWNIRPSAGNFFRREWFSFLETVPGGWVQCVRFWDRAATKPTPENPHPDWTRGLKLYKYPNGTYLVADLKSEQDSPGKIETLIKNTAGHDGSSCKIVSQQDPGSAGVAEAENFVKMLAGYDVHTRVFSKDKATRCKPVSAQAEHGNIYVLRCPEWNEDFFKELESFPDGKNDDIVDTLSGAFNEMNMEISVFDSI